VLTRLCVLILIVLAVRATAGQASRPVALHGKLSVIGRGVGSPDDLAVAADDTIYFGDMAANRVFRLTARGIPEAISPPIREPEGIVPLPDGALIVVEQATNRLYRVDPSTKSMSLFYEIGNATRNLGIDGLSRDPVTGDLLVPDAPTGRILRLSADGRRVDLIASGFKRPTSVALATDGSLFVCDEYGNAIYRVDAKGKTSLVAEVPIPDDVILDSAGMLIVNSLRGAIWRIDAETGQKTMLVTALRSPHGIALDSHGNVIIADAGYNQIFRLILPSTL
jgi:sugar lactone lactonase YvrE